MKPIWLFLPTFRKFVRNAKFNSAEDKLPVFYYEDEEALWFYKIWESTLFYTRISKLPEDLENLPKDLDLDNLKNIEFTAEQIPEQLIKPKILSINNVPIGTIS